jgi:glutamine cyclotransferase
VRRLLIVLVLLAASCTSSGSGEAVLGSTDTESSPTEPPVTATETPLASPEPDDAVAEPQPTATPDEATATPDEATATPDEATTAPRRLVVDVVARFPHDPGAFTQGLVLDGEVLFESTGRDTTLRRVDPDTGEVLATVDVDDQFFGEGLELVDDRLIQLTWQSGVAIVYDVATLEQVGQFSYDTEGWGLCLLDDGRLAMSDGSSRLTFRDPDTFAALGTVDVTLDGRAVTELNELECVGSTVWANVWLTNTIVGIDAATGEVTTVVDAQALDDADPAGGPNQVLNGIAYDPEADTFLLTGKEWSTLFEVRFVDAAR